MSTVQSKVNVSKSGGIIDPLCPHQDGDVYKNSNNVLYSCTLNQTDIKSNKNKFYIMQLINVSSAYVLYTRWGRIGEPGTTQCKNFTDEYSGANGFSRQFKAKTGNDWAKKDDFKQKAGKYFLTEITYNDVIDQKEIEESSLTKIPESKLDSKVQNLISIISDTNMMKNSLVQLDIDPKKMPLGKISKKQIDTANELLINLRDKINSRGKTKKKPDLIDDSDETDNDIDLMTSQFYTLIPYSCGRRAPPRIDNIDMISKLVSLLDELKNLQVAASIVEKASSNLNNNPIDSVYDSLNTQIKPLDPSSEMYKQIMIYMSRKGSTHYHNITVLDIFEIEREGEKEKFEDYCKNIDNRTLLIHGSRMANWCSIMKMGLLLDPSRLGVYISGKMFGYGIYTANIPTKSCNYMDFPNGLGCLLLCEVALGKESKKSSADYYVSKNSLAKEGCHSTWGLGKTMPSSSVCVDGLKIPNGPPAKVHKNVSLQYDEFIVYDANQLRQRYIVLVKNK